MSVDELPLSPVTATALADKIDAADFLLVRNCPMVTKFDHENVDTYLTGEEQNLIVAALRSFRVAQTPLGLGDIVRMNERSPYFYDWKDATMKVVSLRLDPDGKCWVSVIEGDQRHRGNGVYDGETTDIDADFLTAVSDTSTDSVAQLNTDRASDHPDEGRRDAGSNPVGDSK